MRPLRPSTTRRLIALMFGVVCGLAGCDASGYRRSWGRWTHDGVKIAPIDAGTFRPLDDVFARDAIHGYYRGKAIPDSDGASFEALSAHEARDRAAVYWCDTYREGQEYWSIRHLRTDRIPDADATSYRVLGFGHARDAHRVYDEGVPFVVRDPATFEPLDRSFGRDALRGYYRHVEIPGSDGATFSMIDPDDASHVRDRAHVWYGLIDVDHPDRGPFPVVRLLAGGDPATLKVLGRGYAVDPPNVWHAGRRLAGADAGTFRIDESYVGEVDANDRTGAWRSGERVGTLRAPAPISPAPRSNRP